jgi:hypothetical protein
MRPLCSDNDNIYCLFSASGMDIIVVNLDTSRTLTSWMGERCSRP